MVLVYKDMQITTLEDIQKLKVKDLREILRSNSEATGGIKADLVLKVYAILVRHVLRPGENQQQSSDNKTTKIFDLGKIKRILVSKDQNIK